MALMSDESAPSDVDVTTRSLTRQHLVREQPTGPRLRDVGQWRPTWERLARQNRQRRENLPFPTDAQLDLVKAAIMPADQAAPAWRRWKSRGLQITDVDGPSFVLLPQLWANRAAAGVDERDLPLLKGVYRQTFANNAARLSAGLEAAHLLGEAGIATVFFKGGGVMALAGRPGLRFIGDVDILVPEKDARRAIEVLSAAGYRSVAAGPAVGMAHAWGCLNADGFSIDLHWWAFKPAGDDNTFFETAQQVTLLGRPALVPSATESLIVIVANAFQVNGSPLRWIADAMLLFAIGGEIEWDTLLDRARRPGLLPGLAVGLDYLAREFGAAVPAGVLDELRRRPVPWQDRVAFWAAVRRPTVGAGPLELIGRHRARRLHAPDSEPRDLFGYVARVKGAGKRRHLLRRAPRAAIRMAVVLAISCTGRFTRGRRKLDPSKPT